MTRIRAKFYLLIVATGVLAGPTPAGDIERRPKNKVPKVKPPATIAHGQKPMRIKVLAIHFNPFIAPEIHSPDDPKAKPKTIREIGGWNDPIPLAAGYAQDVCDASGGFIQYEIVEWIIAREFQKKNDGFTYTPEQYYRCLTKKAEWHQPDGVDYAASIERFKIVPRIESGEIDEVWWFGAPYYGYLESTMAGKDAFYINGGPIEYEKVKCERPFVIMGFNYERGVAEMLHDLCHRTESTMSRIYGGWKADELTSTWAEFAANAHQSSGVAAAGTCHYPPNGVKDYDYANERAVLSTADDWLNFPNLTGQKKPVSRENWREPHRDRDGNPAYHRNYMKWWFTRLPKAPGVYEDGRRNNWWKYLFDFHRYDERGNPRSTHHSEPRP